jgi:diguanylate cyclase (GGDEF)-like protein
LIMVDLDGFKRYNDRHGHPAGDTVLQAVGQAIDSAIRERDLSFRLGGDEFAILLPRTRELQAARIAERVRLAIKMHPLLAGTLTASVGMSCQSIHAIEKTALIGTADAALYRAKAAGGDRVEAAGRVRAASLRRQPATEAPETNQEAGTGVSQLPS